MAGNKDIVAPSGSWVWLMHQVDNPDYHCGVYNSHSLATVHKHSLDLFTRLTIDDAPATGLNAPAGAPVFLVFEEGGSKYRVYSSMEKAKASMNEFEEFTSHIINQGAAIA